MSSPLPPKNHREVAIITVAIIGPILSAIFVALRVYARKVLQNQFTTDDWVAVITLPFLIAYSACLGIATHHGMGLHTQQMTPELESQWFYWVLIASEFYCCSLFGYKLALLLLYNRLFGVYKVFRYIVYATIFFVFGYLFCNAITEWASCSPIKKFWEPNTPGECTNGTARDIAYGVMNIVSDFIIAILPIPMIWSLKLQRKEKILLTFVFISGGIALTMAIVRSVHAFIDLHAYDRYGIAGLTFLISILEVNTGLVCACTPTLRPLFKIAKERAISVGSFISKKKSRNSSFLNLLRKRSHDNAGNAVGGDRAPSQEERKNTLVNSEINFNPDHHKAINSTPSGYGSDSTGESKPFSISFLTTNDSIQ